MGLRRPRDDVVIHRAGGGDHRDARGIMPFEIGENGRPVETRQPLGRAQNRPTDRLVGEGRRVEQIEHEIVGRVVDLADFLLDDALLARQFGGVENAAGQDVGENVEHHGRVGAEHARVIGGELDRRRRVEVAARALDLLDDGAGAALAGALEGHVLDQMRQTVLVVALVARPGANPDANARGLQFRHGVRDDPQPRWQGREGDAHARAARERARMKVSTTP